DIFREGTFSLSGREMPVICTDNEGETVDVTLLYDNKDYEKIIGLKDKYLRNPFKEFRDLICWSYVEKGHEILSKAGSAKKESQKSRFITESRTQAKSALELESSFIAAINLLSQISIAEGDYEEAIRAMDYILKRDPKNAGKWLDRALALMKLK